MVWQAAEIRRLPASNDNPVSKRGENELEKINMHRQKKNIHLKSILPWDLLK